MGQQFDLPWKGDTGLRKAVDVPSSHCARKEYWLSVGTAAAPDSTAVSAGHCGFTVSGLLLRQWPGWAGGAFTSCRISLPPLPPNVVFNKISIILFTNKTQKSEAGVKTW